MKKTKILILAAGVALAASVALAAPDFSYYVAMGDSLTAGWQSGCLVDRHQLRSYPAVLAQQFGTTVAQVGGDLETGDRNLAHFQQPLVSEPGIPHPCSTLTFDPNTGAIGIDQHLGEAPGSPENTALPRPYNNLGIPGSHSYDMIDVTHSSGTDAFSLVLRNFPGSPLDGTNAVEQAILQHPTFLTIFIGNNDTLDAAGTATVISGSCAAFNPAGGGSCEGFTFTTVDKFTTKYTEMLQTLHAALPNTTIMVVNLHNITSIPFATTVPPVVFNPQTNQPVLDPQGHVIPLIGEAHDGSVGQIDPTSTLVTLPALSLEAVGFGIPCAVAPSLQFCDHPLPDGHLVPPGGSCNGTALANGGVCPGVLLYSDEIALLLQRVATFNQAIATAAAANGAQVFDANGLFKDIVANGRTYGGITVTTKFLTGGFFSYDGVHPSNIGYAIAADEFVKFINATYGASVPRVDVYAALFQPDVAPSSGAAPQDSPRRISLGVRSLYPVQTWQSILDVFGPVDPALKVAPAAAVLRGSGPNPVPVIHR
jgi:lysophospholipase L1-like esterase